MDPQLMARAQMLVQQGVISPAMYEQMMQRAAQQPGGQYQATAPQAPQQAPTQAGRLGQGLGDIVGGIGQKIKAAMQPSGFASGAPSLQTGNGSSWINPDSAASMLAGMPTDL